MDALAVLRPGTIFSEVIVTFFPHGITFFTGDGILEMQGAFLSEEIIYQQEGKLMYTERNGQECPMYGGFEGDGWYWMVRTPGYPRRMRRMTKEIFLELVQRGANWSLEESL